MTLYFTKEDRQKYIDALNTIHFESRLGFLNSTRGLRKSSLHLFIAGTGAGKSTLTRSLVKDILFHPNNDPTICLWLSEETIEEYKGLFAHSLESNEKLLNTNTYSELDNPEASEMHFFEWVEMLRPDILIFDNITTSKFYEGKRPDEQARFATKLKALIKRIDCAGIVIAHADSQQTQQKGGLLDINNIRGSKAICNLAEFAYLLQTIETPEKRFSTIRIAKSRTQDPVHTLYLLQYDPHTKSYSKDMALDFNQFKEAFNARNRL